jgi:hypothetical protein
MLHSTIPITSAPPTDASLTATAFGPSRQAVPADRRPLSAGVQEVLPFVDLPEIPTASDWCQRWNDRRHSWRHIREGGFNHRNYRVAPLDEHTAKRFVLRHHYSGSYPAALRRFGLYHVADGEQLLGVAIFGVPVSERVLMLPLPELRPSVKRL